MSQSYSTVMVKLMIEDLFDVLNAHIQSAQIKTFLPKVLGRQLSSLFSNNLSSMAFEQPIKRKLLEENIGNVRCIEKDTLMPKQLTRESFNDDQDQSTITFSLTSIGLKKQSYLSNGHSLSLSSKPGSIILIEMPSLNQGTLPKLQDNGLEALKSDADMEDPEIQQLRRGAQMRLQKELKYQKVHAQHQKSQKSKSQAFSMYGHKNSHVAVTYDYNCQNLKGAFKDDKIRYYSARAEVKVSNKKYNNNNKTSIAPETIKIPSRKYYNERQSKQSLKPMEMPLFSKAPPVQMKEFRLQKLNEYKKYFGNGYSRLGQINKNIEYTFTSTKAQTDDVFFEKQNLKDSQKMTNFCKLQYKNSYGNRRLTLPKIDGKYTVLDRYQCR